MPSKRLRSSDATLTRERTKVRKAARGKKARLLPVRRRGKTRHQNRRKASKQAPSSERKAPRKGTQRRRQSPLDEEGQNWGGKKDRFAFEISSTSLRGGTGLLKKEGAKKFKGGLILGHPCSRGESIRSNISLLMKKKKEGGNSKKEISIGPLHARTHGLASIKDVPRGEKRGCSANKTGGVVYFQSTPVTILSKGRPIPSKRESEGSNAWSQGFIFNATLPFWFLYREECEEIGNEHQGHADLWSKIVSS